MQNSSVQLGNWVLCHIFLKKGCTKTGDEAVQFCKDYNIANYNVRMDQPRFEHFMMIGNLSETSSTSSSDPSVLTEVSSNQSDYDETSSHVNV